MSIPRTATLTAAALLSGLVATAEARAQACLGLPATDGHLSIEVTTSEPGPGYGGRLGMNFNTPFTLELGLERPHHSGGRGTTIATDIAYKMLAYEPALCPFIGFRYEERPTSAGDDIARMIPIGLGVGRRLGSMHSLSLAVFARPEYLHVLDRRVDDAGTAFDGLADRSEGRGVLGLLVASPFVYATGHVEVYTRDDLDPRFRLGVGMTF